MEHVRSSEEKIVFSPRMEKVRDQVLSRLKPRDTREDTFTAETEADGKNPFLDVFEEMPDAPYVICLAHAIVRSWEVTPVIIHPDEAIVGVTRPLYPFLEHFSWGIRNHGFSLEQLTDDPAERAHLMKTLNRMTPLDWSYMNHCGVMLLGEEKYAALQADEMFFAGGYQGHTVPNYHTLLENGLDGVLAKIDYYAAQKNTDSKAAELYEACRIIVRGLSAYLTRYASHAAALAGQEQDEAQKIYYLQIADNCMAVAHKKPETLYQAVQLMWSFALWDWVDCLGRMDQYLYPFYEKACREKDVISPEEAVTSLMFKVWENGAHNITISGTKPEDGSDATNDLTYLILQILRQIHNTHPRVSVRVRDDIQPELMELIVKIWSEGMSDPTVVSDVNVIPALEAIGVTQEDARDYSMLGCQEIEIPGKSNTGCEDGSFNVAKVFEYAMHGGRSSRNPAVQIGPVTPSFVECEDFETFYAAFEKQIAYFVKIFVFLCDRGQEMRAANFAKLVKTPFTDGCLEKGVPHDAGGPIYNYGVVETAGVAAVADSMTAIKKLVYEEKKISRETLCAALDADFAGYERERQMLLNMAPKFGNDDSGADEMMVRVLNTFWDEIGKYHSVRGGVYTGACSLLTGGIHYGSTMGAMPDGRHAGEPLGNSMGPRPGADKQGVSAMLSSVAKLPLSKGVGGITLNVTLTTKLLSTPALRGSIAATLKNYLCRGGQMAQVTTANLEDLLDAKVHPERHGDLIVRVGGFSIQFVQLDETVQNEIISRYTA